MCWVASVIRTASPRPPPTWREVLTSPEARPAWPSLAPWVAAIVEGTIERPIPAADEDPRDHHEDDRAAARRRSARTAAYPAVIIEQPAAEHRADAEAADEPPAREATSMIVSAIGRNVRPVCSGESPSTCCR